MADFLSRARAVAGTLTVKTKGDRVGRLVFGEQFHVLAGTTKGTPAYTENLLGLLGVQLTDVEQEALAAAKLAFAAGVKEWFALTPEQRAEKRAAAKQAKQAKGRLSA